MFCSTIIPTIGRSELNRAVRSVLEQNFIDADFEVIVVNDSGTPLPLADWQSSERVRILNTNRHERSVARNTGAATAMGTFLHFLDDDDWLLPGALKSFWYLAQRNRNAVWLYGGTQLVDRAGRPLIQLHQEMNGNSFVQAIAGEIVHLQASLIDMSIFFSVGGFNPHLAATEDIDLLRRVALHGNLLGMEDTVVCKVMGEEGSSSNYAKYREPSLWSREQILNEPGAFRRMRQSAHSSYWAGRLVRAYLTSFAWNALHGRGFTAASRATSAMAGMFLSAPRIVSRNFWRAVARSHESESFQRGLRTANRPVER